MAAMPCRAFFCAFVGSNRKVFGLSRMIAEERSASNSIDIAGKQIPIRCRANARAKRITMRIAPDRRSIKVTTPPNVRASTIQDFIKRHRAWLEAQFADAPSVPEITVGHKIPILGRLHEIVHESGRGTTQIAEYDSVPTLITYGDTRFVGRRVADFLKQTASHEIEPLVAHHSKAVSRRATSVRFKDTKTRWGSCSSSGALSFSWRIAMAPKSVVNYLVAHEVAHLVHMNHSPAFWKQTEALCPDYKRHEAWLKRNGSKLQAIVFSSS